MMEPFSAGMMEPWKSFMVGGPSTAITAHLAREVSSDPVSLSTYSNAPLFYQATSWTFFMYIHIKYSPNSHVSHSIILTLSVFQASGTVKR